MVELMKFARCVESLDLNRDIFLLPWEPYQNGVDVTRGVVKWFNDAKGYGFIQTPEGQDVFVHFSTIEKKEGWSTLKDHEEVEYEAQEGPKGLTATYVRRLNDYANWDSTTTDNYS